MENRVRKVLEGCRDSDSCSIDGPQPIGAILAELLAQYQIRFPEARLTVVETPVAA